MKFYGLLGKSLLHSLSPVIHKEIYKRAGIEAAYKSFPFPASKMTHAIEGIKTLSIDGVNVTIPYKESVIPFLDTIDSRSEELQAVNTIHNQNGKLIGYNTDYDGFNLIFKRRNWPIEGKSIVILGSGGAAKMAAHYFLDNKAKNITIVSRSPQIVKSTQGIYYTNYEELNKLSGNYLVNTTPVGMYPKVFESPVSSFTIQHFDTIIDLIYNPYETQFLSIGKSLNKMTANGMDMLVGQAVHTVEIWESTTIDRSITDSLIEQFNKCQDGGK